MSKQPTEIKPEHSQRLKELLNFYKWTQVQLSERSGVSVNTLSKIMNGHSAMTPRLAELICRVCPAIRPDWLTGESEFKTFEAEKFSHFRENAKQWDIIEESAVRLAEIGGYEVVYQQPELEPDDPFFTIAQYEETVGKGYLVRKNGKVMGSVPMDMFSRLCLTCQWLVELQFNSFFSIWDFETPEEGGKSNGNNS